LAGNVRQQHLDHYPDLERGGIKTDGAGVEAITFFIVPERNEAGVIGTKRGNLNEF